MTACIEACHDYSPIEAEAIEDRLYESNQRTIGRNDGRALGFVMRDVEGRIVGAAMGYSWAGTSEIRQMWVDEAYRGRGHARDLLSAFVKESKTRGVQRIWVTSHDFQAPALYEKSGFRRVAELRDWPEGHSKIVLCLTLSAGAPTPQVPGMS
jgi:ribosomal protein S18 acetylase RimI-like enzyme